MADVSAGSFLATGTLRSLHQDRLYQIRVCWAQAQDQEEWKPLALMVAEFEASTPARFNHGPRAVQYVPPPSAGPRRQGGSESPPSTLVLSPINRIILRLYGLVGRSARTS